MSARLPLPERIDLATAADLHSALVSHAGAPLTLDASATRQISTPAVQILLSAAKTWRSNGDPLTIADASPQLSAQLAIAGLSLDDIASQTSETST